jgi:tetratricopeptide (TPR) repeat protein
MIACARILWIGLAVAVGTVPAAADDELLKTQPFPEQQAPAPTPPQAPPKREAPPPAAPQPGTAQRGDPGMMGMPWPKSPEEASKTLSNLYAFLATTGDHRQAGEIGAAIERLWRLSGGDTVNLLIDRAELFSSKNENEKALPLLDAAVDLAPDYAEAWSHRAYIEYRLNNYPAALGDLRRALALDPNHFRALDGMAKILTQIGEKKAALEAYDQLLKIHPNIEGGETARDELKKEVEGQGI